MADISGFGRILIFTGAIIITIGVLFIVASKVPWFGRLPGDIYIKKGNFTFYFPISTCILISIIISFILFLIGRRQ